MRVVFFADRGPAVVRLRSEPEARLQKPALRGLRKAWPGPTPSPTQYQRAGAIEPRNETDTRDQVLRRGSAGGFSPPRSANPPPGRKRLPPKDAARFFSLPPRWRSRSKKDTALIP